MIQSIVHIALVVKDYDEAIDIPGIGSILLTRYGDSPEGWVDFEWGRDFGLWEFAIPIVCGFFQIVYLIVLVRKRRKNPHA